MSRILTPEEVDELTVVLEEIPHHQRLRKSRMRSTAKKPQPHRPAVKLPALTDNQLLAVKLLADGKSKAETARQSGVTDRTIRRWESEEPFQQSVRKLCEQYRKRIEQQGIREQGTLIANLDLQRRCLLRAIADVGASDDMQFVLGGKTGLLKQGTVTVHGTGAVIFGVNVRWLRWLRAAEIRVAKFLGQWDRLLDADPPVTDAGAPAMDRRHELAALWLAQGEWQDKVIARKLGGHRGTIRVWKRDPAVRARIAQHQARWA